MRTFDPKLFNTLINDPEVLPHIIAEAPEKPIDMSSMIMDAANYCFWDGGGGFIVQQLQKGGSTYECHTIFKPGRGSRAVIRFMNQCIEYMFIRTPCTEIVTRVPDNNPGASKLAEWAGFQVLFRREDAWKPGVGISYRSLLLDRWLLACSTTEEAGKAFHRLLEDAKKASGSTLPVHPDDDVHDRWAGAAVKMARYGNVVKAVVTFNRFALFIGHMPVTLVSVTPPVIDIGDAVIGIENGEPEVQLCR